MTTLRTLVADLAAGSPSPVAKEAELLVNVGLQKLLAWPGGPEMRDDHVRRAATAVIGGKPGKKQEVHGATYRLIADVFREEAAVFAGVKSAKPAVRDGIAENLRNRLRGLDLAFGAVAVDAVTRVLARYVSDETVPEARRAVDAVVDLCKLAKVLEAPASTDAKIRARFRDRVSAAILYSPTED